MITSTRLDASAVAVLSGPIPLIGLHGKPLGTVTSVVFCLESRSIARVELSTSGRALHLSGDTLFFDEQLRCFKLQRRRDHCLPVKKSPIRYGYRSRFSKSLKRL